MSKIICDVCGTRYPDSSEQCPICGCVHSAAANEPEQSVLTEEMEASSRPAVRGGRFSKANVRKRNKDLPVYEEPEVRAKEEEEEYDAEEEFEEETGKKGGKVLNVLLVIVILALLAVSSYIFLNYFMPNLMDKEDPTLAPTEAVTEQVTEAPTEETAPTEAPDVPCEQLVLDFTDVTLHEAGEMYLLNVQVLPENTTDGIMYISGNEDVATVNEEGRVTAMGEGTVVISVFCGEQQIECNVVCSFQSATEAPADATEAPADATEASADATEAPADATEAPTEAPAALKNVKLGVKTKDMTFKTGGQQATIKLTCDLKNSEVTWTSEDAKIATVTADGVITRVGAGTTKIIGQYGDQTVEIIVRCPR